MVAAKQRIPDRGDIGWLTLVPQAGREQSGRRPVFCLSPLSYNRKSGLAIFCPITSKKKGYPFEVEVKTDKGIDGVVLTDQLKSLDWRQRDFVFSEKATRAQIISITDRVLALVGG